MNNLKIFEFNKLIDLKNKNFFWYNYYLYIVDCEKCVENYYKLYSKLKKKIESSPAK